jgi:hypothetical protein
MLPPSSIYLISDLIKLLERSIFLEISKRCGKMASEEKKNWPKIFDEVKRRAGSSPSVSLRS